MAGSPAAAFVCVLWALLLVVQLVLQLPVVGAKLFGGVMRPSSCDRAEGCHTQGEGRERVGLLVQAQWALPSACMSLRQLPCEL